MILNSDISTVPATQAVACAAQSRVVGIIVMRLFSQLLTQIFFSSLLISRYHPPRRDPSRAATRETL